MIDMKQIRYFIACAQTESFSQAAEQLYTTQPSVSKVIKAMEDEMGKTLFERYTKGIRLTAEGEYVYKYAKSIMENMEKMQSMDRVEKGETILISCNPSSWFADTFVEFYQEYKAERIHYQIYTTGIREIVRRVHERSDDIGFVYVIKNQLSAFLYLLSRNYLEFLPLKSTNIMLYPGAEHPYWTGKKENMDFSKLRLIQCFPDEFSSDNYWNIQDEKGNFAADGEMVITTNSDYIMERILQTTDLVNISGNYLSDGHAQSIDGVAVFQEEEEQIIFGCIRRKEEELPKWTEKFIYFLKKKVSNVEK